MLIENKMDFEKLKKAVEVCDMDADVKLEVIRLIKKESVKDLVYVVEMSRERWEKYLQKVLNKETILKQ